MIGVVVPKLGHPDDLHPASFVTFYQLQLFASTYKFNIMATDILNSMIHPLYIDSELGSVLDPVNLDEIHQDFSSSGKRNI